MYVVYETTCLFPSLPTVLVFSLFCMFSIANTSTSYYSTLPRSTPQKPRMLISKMKRDLDGFEAQCVTTNNTST